VYGDSETGGGVDCEGVWQTGQRKRGHGGRRINNGKGPQRKKIQLIRDRDTADKEKQWN